MQIEIKIVTSDRDLGLDLVESKRFPERRQIIVPGEAVIISQNLSANDVDANWADITDVIDLVIEINEGTSISSFANWLHGKLKDRTEKIQSFSIAGGETQIDEAEILSAIEAALKA